MMAVLGGIFTVQVGAFKEKGNAERDYAPFG